MLMIIWKRGVWSNKKIYFE